MRREFRKAAAFFSATALAASMLTALPFTASAEEAEASFANGTLTFIADETVGSATVYVASYNDDEILSSVAVKPIEVTAGTNIVEGLTAGVGDRIYVWTENNKPVIKSVTVEETVTEAPTAIITEAPTEIITEAPTEIITEAPTEIITEVPTEIITEAPTEIITEAPTEIITEAPTEIITEAPTEDPGDDVTVIKSWKFDFGTAEDVAEGYTAVTADVNYTLNTGGEDQYGFIGTNEKDYKLGARLDGFNQQEGQVIQLEAGGTTGLNDGIGSVGEDECGNAGDQYYPVRFALKVEDEQYFRVRATVTTLDSTKPATASLYTERKHALYTEKEIPAGETVTTEFTIRTTPIYYQKSDPQGAIADGMVNVAVVGENTALAALEIDQIETAPVLWVIGDSTVTDGEAALPFWPLQNYTGVGSGLTKYLPSNIAMVNEGEGGLNAADNLHFSMAANRIKEGDYMYVEYGHNHKDDGVAGYLSCLDKYYQACKSVGATLILVGPIDRHNATQYDAATNTWSSTLNGFSNGAKAYVDLMLHSGEEAANTFVAKYQTSADDAFAYEAEMLAGEKTSTITNVAFVDLNQPSLDWYETISAKGTVNDVEVTNTANLTNFYFQTSRGGTTDGTHPNDTGAENLAYYFFTTADTDAYPALTPLMANFGEGRTHEVPTAVSADVINLGYPSNDAWPYYQGEYYPYPIEIKEVEIDEDNRFISITAEVVDNFSNYASGVLEILDAEGNVINTYVTANHIDNTTGKGVNTLYFNENNIPTLAEDQTYRIYFWSCSMSEERLLTEEEGGERLSAVYAPTDIEAYLLPGEDGGIETFSYYGKDNLEGAGAWTAGGSAIRDTSLGTDDDGITYANIAVTTAGNSYYVMRPFENLEGGTKSSGKYMIDADIMYVSGSGISFNFAKTIKSSSPFATDELTAFTISDYTYKNEDDASVTINGAVMSNGTYIGSLNYNKWTNVHYELDMDYGIASVSVGGSDPVEVSVPMYNTFSIPSIDTLANFVLNGAKGASFNIKLSNLTVAKLKSSTLPQKTLTVESADEDMGTVAINGEATEVIDTMNSIKAVTATPEDGYEFVQWVTPDGEVFSYAASIEIRMNDDLTLKAEFTKSEYDPISYAYKEAFSTMSTDTLAANGWVSANYQAGATIESDSDHGNYLSFAVDGNNDRNLKGTFPAAAQLAEDYVLNFDMALTYGNNHSSDFVVFDSSASISANTPVEANYILKLNNGGSYSTVWTINGGADTVSIPAGEWVNVNLVVHPSEGTVDVTINNGDTTLFSGTEAINGSGVLGGMNLMNGRYYGIMKIDNIKVYTAAQITE